MMDCELCRRSELLQESQIIFTEETDIINAIFQQRRSLHSHAKGEAGIFCTVDTAMFQDMWMHHSATEYFQPSCLFANGTSFAIAEKATDIHLGAGFSKRKIAWPEPYFYILSEHFLYKEIQGLLEICERYIFVNV